MNTLLLIAALINWIVFNGTIEIVVALILFIVAEIIRRKGTGNKATIATQIICGIILLAYLGMYIIELIASSR